MSDELASLVEQARGGDLDALEQLIRDVQHRIYGLALRMLAVPEDAQDVTQEILVKLVTGLVSFRGESSFTTWAYRVAGEQCLAYILGEVIQVSSEESGVILAITPVAFRQRLARARQRLREFMDRACGLLDPANPCRCHKQVSASIAAGRLNPTQLRFANHPRQPAPAAEPDSAAAVKIDEAQAVLDRNIEVVCGRCAPHPRPELCIACQRGSRFAGAAPRTPPRWRCPLDPHGWLRPLDPQSGGFPHQSRLWGHARTPLRVIF